MYAVNIIPEAAIICANKFPPNSFTIPAVASRVKEPNKAGQNLTQKNEPPKREEIKANKPISGGFSR